MKNFLNKIFGKKKEVSLPEPKPPLPEVIELVITPIVKEVEEEIVEEVVEPINPKPCFRIVKKRRWMITHDTRKFEEIIFIDWKEFPKNKWTTITERVYDKVKPMDYTAGAALQFKTIEDAVATLKYFKEVLKGKEDEILYEE